MDVRIALSLLLNKNLKTVVCPCGDLAVKHTGALVMSGNGYGNGSPSTPGGGYRSGDGKPARDVPAGTQVKNPATGKTGTSDGYGGVHTK
jgi:hypothetical protein